MQQCFFVQAAKEENCETIETVATVIDKDKQIKHIFAGASIITAEHYELTVDFGEERQEGQKVTVSRDVYDEISVGDSINVVVYYLVDVCLTQ